MVEAIRAEMRQLNVSVRDVALAVVSLLPFLVGWLVGFVIRIALWLVASVVAGYKAGRG